jgi:hypothetical protein
MLPSGGEWNDWPQGNGGVSQAVTRGRKSGSSTTVCEGRLGYMTRFELHPESEWSPSLCPRRRRKRIKSRPSGTRKSRPTGMSISRRCERPSDPSNSSECPLPAALIRKLRILACNPSPVCLQGSGGERAQGGEAPGARLVLYTS